MELNKRTLFGAVFALAVLTVAVGLFGYFSPHIAMWRLSSAVEAR